MKISAVVRLFLLLSAVAIFCNAAEFTVGDGNGWVVPDDFGGSDNYYTAWASKQNIKVGDTLVFQWMSGGQEGGDDGEGEAGGSDDTHDVWLMADNTAYTTCGKSGGGGKMIGKASPTRFTIPAPGTYYFICSVSDHCVDFMKMAVTVAGPPKAVVTARRTVTRLVPTPTATKRGPTSTPTKRVSTPKPTTPPSVARTIDVGGSTYLWTIPGAVSLPNDWYTTTWAKTFTFRVGDVLRFKWSNFHDAEVFPDKASFDACDFSKAIVIDSNNNVATFTLARKGMYYFGCGVYGHCGGGMKMALQVV